MFLVSYMYSSARVKYIIYFNFNVYQLLLNHGRTSLIAIRKWSFTSLRIRTPDALYRHDFSSVRRKHSLQRYAACNLSDVFNVRLID